MKLASAPPRIAFENVLVATDLSPLSDSALRWAEAIARRYSAELYVTHVISPAETALVPPEYWGSTQEVIEEAATRQMEGLDANLQGVRHRTLLQHGGVWECICEALEKFEIDLLVMGTHGREGFGRLMMGSVAEEVFRRARCPVLTVGPKVTAPVIGEPGFKEIVFATHFGPESLAAAPYAISLAQEFEARLTLLNVMNEEDFDLPADPQVVLQIHMERLRKIVPVDAELGLEPQCIEEFGKAAEQILRVAEERNAGLLVLGAKATGHMGAATHFSSAIAHKVISSAICPVLTIRG
jgi:nucleotide-binding universal stress UspA family protein